MGGWIAGAWVHEQETCVEGLGNLDVCPGLDLNLPHAAVGSIFPVWEVGSCVTLKLSLPRRTQTWGIPGTAVTSLLSLSAMYTWNITCTFFEIISSLLNRLWECKIVRFITWLLT